MNTILAKSISNRLLQVVILAMAGMGGALAAPVAPNDPPDLGSTPPDLSQSVDPNIVVTFDDSGSMQSTYMGDDRPFDYGSWNGPWVCANVINPDIAKTDASYDIASKAMNGVFYNPDIKYTPPLYEDGTSFPNADATLKAVWQDGIAVNRPTDKATEGTAAYSNNPGGSSSASSGARTDLTGTYTVTSTPNTKMYYGGSCPGTEDAGSCKLIITGDQSGTNTTGCPKDPSGDSAYNCDSTEVCKSYYNNGSCKSHYYPRRYTYTWSDTYQWAITTITTNTTDNRWMCGSSTWGDSRATQNPFDGSAEDPDTGATPNGGPVYWRFKASALSSLTIDSTTGNFDTAGLTALYDKDNWEAVSVPASQYQNFANWYAYYRYRNSMTRTALSRVFGVLGENIRVAWQNINSNKIDNDTVITNLSNNGAVTDYRKSFFNWIFTSAGSSSTPNRASTIRAGKFFSRDSFDLKDPYYDPGTGRDLGCRQNFHMLVTDGYWNEGDPTAPDYTAETDRTLPDGTEYDVSDVKSQIYWDVQGSTYSSSLANIAFYYWSHDLRSDLAPELYVPYTSTAVPSNLFPAKVPTYVKDETTGVTTASGASAADKDLEIYFNPANDPADWRHVVQFLVTLGIDGKLRYSDDLDCADSTSDACALRKGQANSTGSTGWVKPKNNSPEAVDDTWHAAINSRGSYFSAASPSSLVSHLTEIINSIVARSGQSASESVSTSILNQGAVGFQGGYNSSGWTGYLYKQKLNTDTGATVGSPVWDAGCFLTGGICAATGKTETAVDPDSRVIFTSVGSAGSLTGASFQWDDLGTDEQNALKLDPTTTHPDTATTLVPTSNGTSDDNGETRLDYLRGDRSYENAATPSSTNPVRFRSRASVLGAIINSQTVYLGGPSGNHLDDYPVGSPEQKAAHNGDTYEKFVKDNIDRDPMVYVGANDGMVHAFNADSGKEEWAYVPHVLYGNGQLDQLTNPANAFVPTVDSTPTTQDVFTKGAWRTMLVGSLRLGGRGIYALDVTDSDPVTEVQAKGKFMWEFSSEQDSDLGYTYGSPNIARLACNVSPCSGVPTVTGEAGGTWVVLVAGGYFPKYLPSQANGSSTTDTATGVTKTITYLWVLNASDGTVIKKIPTSSGAISYGMSTPHVVDFGLDGVDDVAVAGDLAGNLWRFDLSDPDPARWKVDQMFKTYTSNSPCAEGNPHGIGCEPISVMPVAFPDANSGGVIYVFGSGQYLGNYDRTATNVFTPQHFFGVQDLGTGSASYPLTEANLKKWALTQSSAGERTISTAATSATATPSAGWQIPLNVTGISGERDIATVLPLFTTGAAVLVSLIPGQNNDPCNPGRLGAAMIVDATSGGVVKQLEKVYGKTGFVGGIVSNPPSTGGASAIGVLGGGTIILPGLGGVGFGDAAHPPKISGAVPVWRRTSWGDLLNRL
jgi:type IV pilus assembly protein PilY1